MHDYGIIYCVAHVSGMCGDIDQLETAKICNEWLAEVDRDSPEAQILAIDQKINAASEMQGRSNFCKLFAKKVPVENKIKIGDWVLPATVIVFAVGVLIMSGFIQGAMVLALI